MDLQRLFQKRNITKLAATATAMYLCLAYAQECAEGIRKGILFCVEALIPSLFLLMALSSYVIRSGTAGWLSKPFSPVARHLFRLPSQGFSVILLSMIGGYPVGARCAAMLYEQGELSESEATKTAYIAVCAGPGFVVNFVGGALLHHIQAGVLLLISELAGVIATGVIVGRTVTAVPIYQRRTPPAHQNNLLVNAVADASRATFHMCGMVVICTAMIEVITAVVPSQTAVDVAAALTEITAGCRQLCGNYPLPLIAFFIGFGGISVHLQIYAGLDGIDVHKGIFFLYRLIQGIITAAAAYIFLIIFPIKQSVFNSIDVSLTAAKSATLFGSAALALSSLCFLGSIHQKQLRR